MIPVGENIIQFQKENCCPRVSRGKRYYKIRSYRKTACEFGINVKTVLKWVKRYQYMGLSGLRDLPQSPKSYQKQTLTGKE